MKRRDFLKAAGAGAAVLAMPGCAQTPQCLAKGKKPNIVYIMLDELGYFELSCMGSKYHKTPNIDQMAAEGIRSEILGCIRCHCERGAAERGNLNSFDK